jgi:hypothetical protein
MSVVQTEMSNADTRAPARDPDEAAVAPILLTVLVLLAGWGTSVALWGIPGLYIPALATVPVIWTVLVLISRG